MTLRLVKIISILIWFTAFQCESEVLKVDAKSGRNVQNFNLSWTYHKGALTTEPSNKDWSIKGWQSVSLPHTYQLTSINLNDSEDDKTQQTFHRDQSWYQKSFTVDASNGHRVFVEFEGAHQKTQVWVNGKFVGEHVLGGYTPFHFDITDSVIVNQTNTIAVKLDNRLDNQVPPDGHSRDYILFGGLYRDVNLTVTDALHFSYNWESQTSGIFVTTPTVNKHNAAISVRTEIINQGGVEKDFLLQTLIVDAQNKVVGRKVTNHSLKGDKNLLLTHTLGIDKNVRLWSPESPYLYRIYSRILGDDGKVLDMLANPLGLRTFELRLGQGLLLNGKPIEIIGANRHQHYPYIGDAVPNNLHRNDAIKFKQAGMNLVRLAHYPHDNAFIEACDELGLIVVEEPPTWIEFGDEVWMDRLDLVTRRMIRNHRNHPSILGWGAGINHRGTIKRLHYAAKEEDPYRITMNNGTLWTGEQHSGVTDLYAVMDYRGAQRRPDDLLFAMEHSGSLDSRSLQQIVSRYKGDPNLIGLASWSAHDSNSFIKRDEQYPNLSAWSASSWDAFRLPKPNFYWYQSELTSIPMVHIPDKRAQNSEFVQIFTNTDEIELFHDGKTHGRYKPTYDETNQYLKSPSILVPFKWPSGTLVAKGYIDNEVVAEHQRTIAGKAVMLDLKFDTTGYDFVADGSSIVMAYARVLDKDGNVLSGDTPPVEFSITGDGQIVGDASIDANPVVWRNGVAPVLIRVGTADSTISLTAQSQGLVSSTDRLRINQQPDTQTEKLTDYFLDPLQLSVDFGNLQQHPQEDFYIWSNKSGNDERVITANNGQEVKVQIQLQGGDAQWDHTWGVPGDLSFMIEDGVASKNGKAMMLTFVGLPAGRYELKTWHHMLTSKIDDVPVLSFAFDSDDPIHQSPIDYQPTYGQKIEVSEAGGGQRGDGGSNKGANGFAKHYFEVQPDQNSTELAISMSSASKLFRLNGFVLNQLVIEEHK